MKNLLIISLLFFLVSSCSQQEKKEGTHGVTEIETTEEYKETMIVHDEVMPKMDNIMQLKKQLKARVDSLSHDSNSDTTTINNLNPLIVELEDADKAMMDWMHQFDGSKKSDTTEATTQYYMSQKEIIAEVANKMNTAIKNAEEILD